MEELFKKYIKPESIDKIRKMINDIESLGYIIIHKYEDGFPMLLGGTEIYARKGKLFMIYSTKGFLSLQCNEDDVPNWEKDFICKYYKAPDLITAYKEIV